MKLRLLLCLCIISINNTFAQKTPDIEELYSLAMKAYDDKRFHESAMLFTQVIDIKGLAISSDALYNGACIYALDGDKVKAFELLNHIVLVNFFYDSERIIADSDLNSLHEDEKWAVILEKTKENKQTLPERRRKLVLQELLNAKTILQKEAGALWGERIWNDSIIVIDDDNMIYSLVNLPNSETKDKVLFYRTISENTLSHTNTQQVYEGNNYVTVQISYLNDSSATIIHELFHLLQSKKKVILNGNAVAYLDEYDARELIRLEFQALRNALDGINNGQAQSAVLLFVNDALLFRKTRQSKYKAHLNEELGIETSEGLANYTGFKLSSLPNKYVEAIHEINDREEATTFTRSFPYATGPAYGLIFDYLGLKWRSDLNKQYAFLEIYERLYLKKSLSAGKRALKVAKQRNNYIEIHQQEDARKAETQKCIAYYTNMFIKQPTLTVHTVDSLYSGSFDMNSTFSLKGVGTIYTNVQGTDQSGNNFGNYTTTNPDIGVSGVLISADWKTYTFPKPTKIEEHKIVGANYSIELHNGWVVMTVDKRGNMILVKPNK